MQERQKGKSFREALRHAFALPSEETLTPQQKEWLEAVARKVCERGLMVPALLLLESGKPLTFVASQAVVFFKPIISVLFPPEKCDEVAALLEKRSALENLFGMLEDFDREGKGPSVRREGRR